MKYIALYLPQYHSFPENDEWWGNGYTEWNAVKRGIPLFKGHNQPRVPLNGKYYDLIEDGYETLKWQGDLAKRYGIYGFCFYQYWFCGHLLMEKPAEILLKNSDININFCFSWANETWTRTWYGKENEVLIEQTYGTEADWIKHFEYLLPFFLDKRYIKVNGKPMFCIYRAQDIECLPEMLNTWNNLAKQAGLPGLHIVAGNTARGCDKRNIADAYYNFEPGLTIAKGWHGLVKERTLFLGRIKKTINRHFHMKFIETKVDANKLLPYINSDQIRKTFKNNTYLGAFPQWDNTPRRGCRGLVYVNTTPSFFEKQLTRIKEISEENSFVFINAWNEWGEGCYLEPDERNKYNYLEVIRNSLEEKQ